MTAIAFAQGAYFVVTGLWALVHIESFQKITGPKTDLWLVKTVGVLLIVIGAGLIVAGVRDAFDPALIFVAMASSAGLIGIELIYVYRRVISPVYLIDAAIEIGLIAGWTYLISGVSVSLPR